MLLKGDARVMPINVSVEVASNSVASHDALLGVRHAACSDGGDVDEGGG
jgi:hypothetical protein